MKCSQMFKVTSVTVNLKSTHIMILFAGRKSIAEMCSLTKTSQVVAA